MRIIAGKYKRTPLKTLEGEEITRPTRDMVKEALFSSIAIYSDTTLLDLFSGSGAIGLEALSRGAKEVVFNDISRQAAGIIRENLKKVHEERLLLQLNYEDCLKKMKGRRFDYIFCDPPYAFKDYGRIFSLAEEYDALNDEGVVIIEARKNTELEESYGSMKLYKEKRYGISKLLYYRKETK